MNTLKRFTITFLSGDEVKTETVEGRTGSYGPGTGQLEGFYRVYADDKTVLVPMKNVVSVTVDLNASK